MNDVALRLSVMDAAHEGAAMAARRVVCRALDSGFERLSDSLLVHGHIFGPQRINGTSPTGNGDDRFVALGYLAKTAGALIRGALGLALADNAYACSALNRQLVEVEYLAWAFAEDQEEAQSWLRSSKQQRLDHWQPRHLRERSGAQFRGRDYSCHCESGGHPTPAGMRQLLKGNSAVAEIVICEVAIHGTSTWEYLTSAVNALCLAQHFEPRTVIPQKQAGAVQDAVGEWRTHERLAVTWLERPSY